MGSPIFERACGTFRLILEENLPLCNGDWARASCRPPSIKEGKFGMVSIVNLGGPHEKFPAFELDTVTAAIDGDVFSRIANALFSTAVCKVDECSEFVSES